MLIEQNINIDSACEHHFLPIVGYAHIAYVPNKKVINCLHDYETSHTNVEQY